MLPKVIQGKDGWLFLDRDSNKILQQITGELTFSERRLLQWQYVLETRHLWLKEKGISYFFLVAPNKECVYPEYLPDEVRLSEARCVNQLIQHLQSNACFQIIYPLSELLIAKTKLPVYRIQDTHWNAFGAFVAYQSLMQKIAQTIGVPILQSASLSFFECSKPGDLGIKLNLLQDTTLEVKFIDGKSSSCVINNQVHNRGNFLVFEHQNKSLPTAILFRDSFAIELLPFIAESFSRLIVSWQPNIDYILIQREKPDIVISEQVERYLIDIPNDSHGPTNAELVREKMQS